MNRLPAALFVVDLKREKNCILEAKKLGIPVVAMVDTNCDPDDADFPIPGNDDAVRAIQLFAGKIAEALEEGRASYQEHAQSARQRRCHGGQDRPRHGRHLRTRTPRRPPPRRPAAAKAGRATRPSRGPADPQELAPAVLRPASPPPSPRPNRKTKEE